MKQNVMSLMKNAKWENWFNFIVGLWVTALPWITWRGFVSNAVNVISWNFLLIGLTVCFLSIISIRQLKPWPEWLIFLSGLWLFFSPWFLVYSDVPELLWNSIVPGLLISISAGIALPIAEKKIYHRVTHKMSKDDNILLKH